MSHISSTITRKPNSCLGGRLVLGAFEPSDASPPTSTRVQAEKCRHTIHSAYAHTYTEKLCPTCRLLYAIADFKEAEKRFEKHGSAGEWREKNTGKSDKLKHITLLLNGGSRIRHGYLDEGRDVSYRHSKKFLVNLAIEFERLKSLEVTYAEQQSMAVKKHGATRALKAYNEAVKRGFLTVLDDNNLRFCRKRGREWQITTDPDYPQCELRSEDGSFKPTLIQRQFIEQSKLPSVEQADASFLAMSSNFPIKRKRLANAKVRFNPEVLVRTEANIDMLSWLFRCSESNISNEEEDPVGSDLPRSTQRPRLATNGPTPRSVSFVIDIKKQDNGRHPSRFRRESRRYDPGCWAVEDDKDFVDTSYSTVDVIESPTESVACMYAQEGDSQIA